MDYDGDGLLDTWSGLAGMGPYNVLGARHNGLNAHFACVDGHAELWHISDLAINKKDIWGCYLLDPWLK